MKIDRCRKSCSFSGRIFRLEYSGAADVLNEEKVINRTALFCSTLIFERFLFEVVPHPSMP